MADTILGRRALVGLGAGTALAAATQRAARAQPATTPWQPQIETQDAWLDRLGTRHRLVFDTISAEGASEAIFYADNFYAANKSAYNLADDALGVVIILRHMSTPFGYNDAMWAKYGATFAEKLGLKGKQKAEAANANPLNIADDDMPAKGEDTVTLATLAKKGVQFAVCGMATEAIAGMVAKATKQDAAAVKKELSSNLVGNSVLVAAGIVTVNRAQEHGYAFAYTG
jgi:intracellular sulfur oxidation DsrE/DsrF family protein